MSGIIPSPILPREEERARVRATVLREPTGFRQMWFAWIPAFARNHG